MQKAARRFFTRSLTGATAPAEVTTDRAPAYPRIVEDMLPGALHVTAKYANNRDRGRPRPAQGPAPTHARDKEGPIAADHRHRARVRAEPARGHYELATDATTLDRVAVAFTELALAV